MFKPNDPKKKRNKKFFHCCKCINPDVLFAFEIMFFIIINLITIADIVIQFINPNGLNNLLINDILFALVVIAIFFNWENFLKYYINFFPLGYIANFILYMFFFAKKNKTPKYIDYFYVIYFYTIFVSLIMMFFIIPIFCWCAKDEYI